jgi:acetyl-CoA C-acetyltransferase
MMPVRAFALMDTALRHADGIDIDAHRDRVARLWANMSEVAASNPHAWYRKAVSFEEIRDAGGKNRMMSFPYTKRHNSDWNVDQAAGLIFCSFERAVALGLDETRFVYPLSATESNHVVSFAARPELHRSPGAAIAGRRALELAGTRANEVEHLEIYSCFPAPVQVFARELDLPDDRPLTVTGGMPFAGGPLNNYVLQATVRMAEVLRQDPGDKGLVTSISGFHNKQGFGLWSTTPPIDGFVFEDCTAEVAGSPDGGEIELVGDYSGAVQIATYTVVYLGDEPAEGVAICDLPDGRRTIGVTHDAALLSAMVSEEFCGRAVRVAADGDLTLS